jgi:hypothetical protein
MKKVFGFLILIIILLGLFVSVVYYDQAVVFVDPNFETAIREKLNHFGKPIYRSQLLSIVELDLSSRDISNLTGIEHFRNLEVLNLNNNNITEVSALKTLTTLRELDLGYNQMINLRDANLDEIAHINLVSLNLDHNLIEDENRRIIRLSDISPLSEFLSLEALSLQDNTIDDWSPLIDLQNLKALNIAENKINNIEFLMDFTDLQSLNLRENDIQDISIIADMVDLTYLNLHSNSRIPSLEPLANLENLQKLILRNVPVGDDIDYLLNLKNLEYLNLQNCTISDYSTLSEMMAMGYLQDDPAIKKSVYLNIRDNIIPDNATDDPLLSLRPYWENIAIRDPYELPPLASSIELPSFSFSAGYYTEEFLLTLSTENPDLEIYYTLDGSNPEIEHVSSPKSDYQTTYLYTEPIPVGSRVGEENVYSMVQTAYQVRSWLPDWSPPKGEVFKGTVFRAIAYDPERDLQSNVLTQTYFVDEDIFDRYSTLPVISLVGDYDVLFDPEEGIYITDIGRYPFLYNDSKVPANLEFFESDGSLGFEGRYEISLHGATSWASPQKGLHVFADPWSSGEQGIHYPIFKDSESKANNLEEFQRFILRAWGSARNWPVFFADAYNQTLMAQSDQDIQDYQPVIVFINGEYWGLHEIREANKNSWYYQAHYYDGDDVQFDLLEYRNLIDGLVVDEGDSDRWDDLMRYIAEANLGESASYAYVSSQIDIANFIDYVIHCVYTGKVDWPGQNESMWRPGSVDGKWRWTQFDMDQGFGMGAGPETDVLAKILSDGNRPHYLFNQLLNNQDFKNQFINRFADLMNTYFLTEVERQHFHTMVAELDPYIPEYQDRWQLNYDWEDNKQFALDLINRRWDIRREQIIKNFDLSGSSEITLLADVSMGSIVINNMVIDENLPGVPNPERWTGMYFHDVPINIQVMPLPGYRFLKWETNVEIDSFSDEINLYLDGDLELKAIFEPEL